MNKKVAAPVQKTEINGRGDRCADHVTPLYPQKLALTSPTGGGRSVGIVRSRTKATEFFFFTGLEWPRGFQEVRFLRFHDNGTQEGGKVVSSAYRPHLPPGKFSWYSFLLEAESTPGP